MLFNTIEYLVFFGVVLSLYWALPHRGRSWLLLVAGYFFYGCWDWRFLGLLLFSTLMDYTVGLKLAAMTHPRSRKLLLAISVSVNLGLLCFFKYFNFFAENLHELLLALGVPSSRTTLNVILPVGISFYTFQSMSYAIDVYRRQITPTRDLLNFAVFVAFFPQLVAGPIERAAHMLPQVRAPKRFDGAAFLGGIELILWGLFKKMFAADSVAKVANVVFTLPVEEQTGLQLLLGVYAFAIQIYCDFSGYSDIARGSARCLGFELMINFRCPYFAADPQEFWRRWHISLSTWLRDYLYVPLGGSRHGRWMTYRNLALTMLLGGLWHGAAWTFVIWGAFHGALLAVHRMWLEWRHGSVRPRPHAASSGSEIPPPPSRSVNALAWAFASRLVRTLLFFHLICIGWVFFRAESLPQAWGILTHIPRDFQLGAEGWAYCKTLFFYGGFLLLADALTMWEVKGFPKLLAEDPRPTGHWLARGALSAFCAAAILTFGVFDGGQFIYFQF